MHLLVDLDFSFSIYANVTVLSEEKTVAIYVCTCSHILSGVQKSLDFYDPINIAKLTQKSMKVTRGESESC